MLKWGFIENLISASVVKKDYNSDIIPVSSPGIANIVFKSKANSVLQIQELRNEDDANIDSVAKKIVSKIKETLRLIETCIKWIYSLCKQDISPILAKLDWMSPSLLEDARPTRVRLSGELWWVES